DLFSLGCVLYHLLTGQAPFRGATPWQTILAVQTTEPTPPGELSPAVPPALARLVMQLLAKRPEDRPPSAEAALPALDAGAADRTERLPAPWKTPTVRPRRGRRFAVLAAAALLLAGLGGGGWWFGPMLYRFATDQGELVVESSDPEVEVAASAQGATIHDK